MSSGSSEKEKVGPERKLELASSDDPASAARADVRVDRSPVRYPFCHDEVATEDTPCLLDVFPDGKRAVTASGKKVAVWSLE